MIKKVAAIVVLIMVASLSVAGCTSSTTSSPTPLISTQQKATVEPTAQATPTPSAHNPALEKLVNEFKQAQNTRIVRGSGTAYPTFNVTWHNKNSVTLETFFSYNPTFPENTTWIAFPTTNDAANYLKSVDKSGYSLSNNTDAKSEPYAGQYYNATGYYAQTYQDWVYTGPLLQTPSSEMRSITQWDNIIEFTTMYIPTFT